MQNARLIKAKAAICFIIVAGMLVSSSVGYRTGDKIVTSYIEHVTALTSDSVHHRIQTAFIKPINIALTMANDVLLTDLLKKEHAHLENKAYEGKVTEYLAAYKEKYGYESVFLISTATNRYYTFKGVDRIIQPDNPEESWYNHFLQIDAEYALDIDTDKAAQKEITVFINCRMRNDLGDTIGIVGVGFRIDHFQHLLQKYETEFGVVSSLVDEQGHIMISAEKSGFEMIDFFSLSKVTTLHEAAAIREVVMSSDNEPRTFWNKEKNHYIVLQYIPVLSWYLIIEHDTAKFDKQLRRQIIATVLAGLGILAAVLLVFSFLIRRYDAIITQLATLREQERQAAFRQATEQLYDNIYEMDITHNRAATPSTEQYFESLGIPGDSPLDVAFRLIARKQVKEEFQELYLSTFLPEYVLRAFNEGTSQLSCQLMITLDGTDYLWFCIDAHIYFLSEEQSVRMITYFKNIDEKKREELFISAKAETDEMTTLYNKAATERRIKQALSEKTEALYAFFIIDIDNFKHVNDTFGHAFGDFVLTEFAAALKRCFRIGDIIGRFGGDEFIVFLSAPNVEWVIRKAEILSQTLEMECAENQARCSISASIGIALTSHTARTFKQLYKNADSALYESKNRGKNTYTLYRANDNSLFIRPQ